MKKAASILSVYFSDYVGIFVKQKLAPTLNETLMQLIFFRVVLLSL